MSATKCGHANVVETLLQRGASIDMQDEVSTFAKIHTYNA